MQGAKVGHKNPQVVRRCTDISPRPARVPSSFLETTCHSHSSPPWTSHPPCYLGPARSRAPTRTQAGNRAETLPRYAMETIMRIIILSLRTEVATWSRITIFNTISIELGGLSVLSSPENPLPKVPLEFVQRTLARQRWRLKGAFRKLGSDDPMLHAMWRHSYPKTLYPYAS